MDFAFVTSRIATGVGLQDASDVQALANSGITAVLDAREHNDDFVLFGTNADILLSWNPTEDDGAVKPVSYWKRTLDFALPLFSKPHMKLYFHCLMGENRGPSNAFCVMVALGWEPQEALNMIHVARPVTVGHVRYHADALDALHKLGYL